MLAKKKEKPRDDDPFRARPAARKEKRQSGRSWRDYNVDEDGGFDEDDDWEF